MVAPVPVALPITPRVVAVLVADKLSQFLPVVTLVTTQNGALPHVLLKVTTHEPVAEPIVTLPALSVPVIVGEPPPQVVRVGLVLEA